MEKMITRTPDELAALEALDAAIDVGLDAALDIPRGTFTAVELIERELLARGYVLTKIEEVKGLHEVVDEYNEECRKSSSLGFFD